MLATLGWEISNLQWTAIVLQVSYAWIDGGIKHLGCPCIDTSQVIGLAATQYSPLSVTEFPSPTYLILFSQILLGVISNVYRQRLNERLDTTGSSHAHNMILFATGALFNLLGHLLIKVLKGGEPGLFTGYGSFDAMMVIISNVAIGLTVTTVYKCEL